MGNNVLINGRTAVHAGSEGTVTTPDVCKTGGKCRPQTFTNVAKSADAAQAAPSVSVNGNPACHKDSNFAVSYGDEPGSCGGTTSGTVQQKAEFVTFSNDTYIEGKPATRQFDQMVSNNRNTPPMPLMQPGAGQPPALSPEGADGLQEEALPHKLVPILAAKTIPEDIAGNLTAIDRNKRVSYKTRIGSAENLGQDTFGLNKWALNFPNVQADNYRLFLSFVDHCGQSHEEIETKLKDREYPGNLDQYHIPLGPLLSVKKDKEIEYSDLELVPTYPLRLLAHDQDTCTHLRSGWLYIFFAGHLWREIKVDSEFNMFTDVNLATWQGQDKRVAHTQTQSRFVLLPRVMTRYSGAAAGEHSLLKVAFSEEQWSWSYIERLGGMDRNDPRYIADLEIFKRRKQNKLTADLDSKFQHERLQSVKLANYAVQSSSIQQARNNYVVPLQEAESHCASAAEQENIDFIKLQNIDNGDLVTGLPALACYDPIGEARDKAAYFHVLLLNLQEIIREVSGRLSKEEKAGLSATELRKKQSQAINYKTACVLMQYLYVALEQDMPDGLTAEQKEDLQKSLNDRKKTRSRNLDEGAFFDFLRKQDRDTLHKLCNDAKSELVEFIRDSDSSFNFSLAMQDLFTLTGEDYYLKAMRTMSDVTQDILKGSHYLDAHLLTKPFDQLDYLENDKGLHLMLDILNCGKQKHRLHEFMFPQEKLPAGNEESSLYDYTDIEVPPGQAQFSVARLAAMTRGLHDGTLDAEDQFQVIRRFGEALGAWSETHANAAHTLFTAAKVINDAKLKVDAETGQLIQDHTVTKQLEAKYAKIADATKKWRRIFNHLMRVHYVSNIVPFEAVPLPEGFAARGPYPEGFKPLDLVTKIGHAEARVNEITKTQDYRGVQVDVSDQYGNSLGKHALTDVLNLDASLSEIHDIAEKGGQPKPAKGKTYVEVYLFREKGAQLNRRMTSEQVDKLLREREATYRSLADQARAKHGALADDLARNQMIAELEVNSRLNANALGRVGYNVLVLPFMVAVNGVNFGNLLTRAFNEPSARARLDVFSAMLDLGAVSAEASNVIARHIHGVPTQAQLVSARQQGLRTVFKVGMPLSIKFSTLAGSLNIVAGVVTAGISLYDMAAAITVGDDGAAAGNALIASGAIAGAAAGWLALPGVTGTLVGLGATGIGVIAVILILAGALIIWLCRDTPLEQWLKNSPWGKNGEFQQYQYDQTTGKYKMIRVPITMQRYGGRDPDGLVYKANQLAAFDWIIPDNEFVAWRKYPELSYQRLMDLINRPHVQFKDREETDTAIVLQVFTQGFHLSRGDLELEMHYETDSGTQGRLDLTSAMDSGEKRKATAINLPQFWNNARVKLIRDAKDSKLVNGLEISMTREDFTELRKQGEIELTAKLRSWPIGKNQGLVPDGAFKYSLPDPERDDEGKVKDEDERYLQTATTVIFPGQRGRGAVRRRKRPT